VSVANAEPAAGHNPSLNPYEGAECVSFVPLLQSWGRLSASAGSALRAPPTVIHVSRLRRFFNQKSEIRGRNARVPVPSAIRNPQSAIRN